MPTGRETLSTQYYSTQLSAQVPLVIPAKAGIQAAFLDSGQKHAGMTALTMDTIMCGSVLRLRIAHMHDAS